MLRRILLCALIAAGAPTAASAAGPATLVAPLPGGTVDFADRIPYRLSGDGCDADAVRIVVTTTSQVDGAASTPLPDPLKPGTCIGAARVPSQAEVRGTGWEEGDPIGIAMTSDGSSVALRYQRVEVDLGTPAAGAPSVVTPDPPDSRAGSRDRAMQMTTGDSVALGRVDISRIHSISVRVCVPGMKPHIPAYFALRADSPTGPAVVGPVDIADDLFNDWKSMHGWPDCWHLLPWPITGAVPERAPELFATIDLSPVPVLLNHIDFNGTGIKVPDEPAADPPGTQVIFDGTSFDGWNQSGCALADGGVRTVHASDTDMGGCSMRYTVRELQNVMVRLEYRLQSFGANGGVFLDNEIQMREAGEWMTGGFQGDALTPSFFGWLPLDGVMDTSGGGYPAQRIKSNSWPDWSVMEVIQLGARHIVRINGRTVTDHTTASAPDPYRFSVSSQPVFSEEYGVAGRFDTMTWNPDVTTPSEWGNVWYRNIRVYDCASESDPVCAGGPGVQG